MYIKVVSVMWVHVCACVIMSTCIQHTVQNILCKTFVCVCSACEPVVFIDANICINTYRVIELHHLTQNWRFHIYFSTEQGVHY